MAKAQEVQQTPAEAKQARAKQRALDSLVFWAGSKSELAAIAQVSRVAVSRWFSRGVIGKEAALLLSLVKGCPLEFRAMRPDLRGYEFTPDAVRAAKVAARDSNRYLQERARKQRAAAQAARKAG